MSIASTNERGVTRDLLRRALASDAVVVALSGAALTFGAGFLADPLGLPVPLMRITGLCLLPYSAIVMRIARRRTISRKSAWTVIGLNALWVVASLLLLLTGWIRPTSLGIAFVLIQALIVAGFVDVEYLGLRRTA